MAMDSRGKKIEENVNPDHVSLAVLVHSLPGGTISSIGEKVKGEVEYWNRQGRSHKVSCAPLAFGMNNITTLYRLGSLIYREVGQQLDFDLQGILDQYRRLAEELSEMGCTATFCHVPPMSLQKYNQVLQRGKPPRTPHSTAAEVDI